MESGPPKRNESKNRSASIAETTAIMLNAAGANKDLHRPARFNTEGGTLVEGDVAGQNVLELLVRGQLCD